MPGGGSKPGERRGGRQKGTANKRTQGRIAAQEEAQRVVAEQEQPRRPTTDSLQAKRSIVATLIDMANEEQRKRALGMEYDQQWLRDTLEAADKAVNGLLPYEHRRLATLEPAMETVVKPDGSVHVTISRTDSEL